MEKGKWQISNSESELILTRMGEKIKIEVLKDKTGNFKKYNGKVLDKMPAYSGD